MEINNKYQRKNHNVKFKKQFTNIINEFGPRIRYILDKKGRRVGVFIHYYKGGKSQAESLFGWSKVNLVAGDKFCRYTGVNKAFSRATELQNVNVPFSMKDEWDRFTSKFTTVTKDKVNHDKDIKLRLELTVEELVSLMMVLGLIGGSQQNSPRKYTDAILDSISSQFDYVFCHDIMQASLKLSSHHIWFVDFAQDVAVKKIFDKLVQNVS